MSARRAPLWIVVIAASFIGYFCLIVYCAFRGPGEPGFVGDFADGRMVLRSVPPDSPAGRAGLQSGDRILSIEGQPITSRFDLMAVAANWASEDRVPVEIERDGERSTTSLMFKRRSWSEWGTRAMIPAILMWTVRLLILASALVIALRRPDHPIALIGAWFLASASVSSVLVLSGMAAVFRQIPSLLSWLLWFPMVSTLLLAAIYFTFFSLFPAGLFRRRWLWAAVWAPAMLELPWFLGYLHRVFYRPDSAAGYMPGWILPAFVVTFIGYLLASAAALRVNYKASADINERRRMRLLAVGAGIGWAAALPIIVFDWKGSASSLAPAFFSSPIALLAAALFIGCVVSLSYALLSRKVFGIRLMIRLGIRYALARSLLLSLTPAIASALIIDLLINSDRTVGEVLQARGWIYLTLGGAATVARLRRQRWLDWLDRRFFRERYDAQLLLREVVEQIQAAADLEQAAPLVVARIEAALHPEFVALLIRKPGQPNYRSLAAAPAGEAPPSLPGESKLMALVRVLGKPLEMSMTSAGWLKQQLPHQDTDFLRRAHIELLVPVTMDAGFTEAVLALGTKRSEEPYTREDRDLLVAVATSVAFLIRRPATASRPGTGFFKECPECGSCYESDRSLCALEGADLTVRSMPRMLVGRYRLERRLGEGGMGAVYDATDVALGRHVAVKLIHEDLVGSRDAAERFRREARAIAGFSHPNIVTVNDFGVMMDTRAFLVMELLKGSTLREEILRQKRLSAERTRQILRGICEAVEAAHRRQLIHRDLKPENVFLVRSETVEISKILDFGVAKSLRAMTVDGVTQTIARTDSGVLVGTLRYMAPEQILCGAPTPAWDLWALAVMSYEMLTGVHPFVGAMGTELQREKIMTGEFIPFRTYVPEAPPGWDGFYACALSPDPRQRPSSAQTFLEGLEQVLTGNPPRPLKDRMH